MFGTLDAYELPARRDDRGHVHHLYVLKLRPGMLSIGRHEFIDELQQAGIRGSVHFIRFAPAYLLCPHVPS